MASLIDTFPKTLDISPYLETLPSDILEYLRLDSNTVYLRLLTTTKHDIDEVEPDQFRLAYVSYDFEGAQAYFPFREEDIYEFESSGFFFSNFSGGFVGKSFNDLELFMENWLKEIGYL